MSGPTIVLGNGITAGRPPDNPPGAVQCKFCNGWMYPTSKLKCPLCKPYVGRVK